MRVDIYIQYSDPECVTRAHLSVNQSVVIETYWVSSRRLNKTRGKEGALTAVQSQLNEVIHLSVHGTYVP